MQIARRHMVAIAERALDRTAEQTELPDELRADILDVAESAPLFTLDWWAPEMDCGCLVGTLRHNRGVNETPMESAGGTQAERTLGMEFVLAVHEHFGGYPVRIEISDEVASC